MPQIFASSRFLPFVAPLAFQRFPMMVRSYEMAYSHLFASLFPALRLGSVSTPDGIMASFHLHDDVLDLWGAEELKVLFSATLSAHLRQEGTPCTWPEVELQQLPVPAADWDATPVNFLRLDVRCIGGLPASLLAKHLVYTGEIFLQHNFGASWIEEVHVVANEQVADAWLCVALYQEPPFCELQERHLEARWATHLDRYINWATCALYQDWPMEPRTEN